MSGEKGTYASGINLIHQLLQLPRKSAPCSLLPDRKSPQVLQRKALINAHSSDTPRRTHIYVLLHEAADRRDVFR